MKTDLFDYPLPPERIAQTPLPRGQSRLLTLNRDTGEIAHRSFSDLLEYLRPGDTLVLNDTRVTARRLEALRESGQPAEVMLLNPVGKSAWEALVKPGKSLRPGKTVTLFGPSPDRIPIPAQVVATTPEGGRILDVGDASLRDRMMEWGVAPLPPYIHEPLPREQEARYQTVYAKQGGSAAAPTAGLHFTPELLRQSETMGVRLAFLTLHVGVGTFRPVRTDDIASHEMHSEAIFLSKQTADILNATSGRIIAVGTTSLRTLESVAARAAQAPPDSNGHRPRIVPYIGETNLFITPGYRFRLVDALITNFHLPKSTLLMLVSAFATRERVLHAYAEAVRLEYRFFSFGDAMLLY